MSSVLSNSRVVSNNREVSDYREVPNDREDSFNEYTLEDSMLDIEELTTKHENMELWYRTRYYELQMHMNNLSQKVVNLEKQVSTFKSKNTTNNSIDNSIYNINNRYNPSIRTAQQTINNAVEL